ncbi:hypothetical protein LX36DRAFT_299493 [Colletotrichum falcatum]|nr:hypothetical protein LX36DRAFT_299493 [Colletotrichum falcatum]
MQCCCSGAAGKVTNNRGCRIKQTTGDIQVEDAVKGCQKGLAPEAKSSGRAKTPLGPTPGVPRPQSDVSGFRRRARDRGLSY